MRAQKRKFIVHERECIDALEKIADDVCSIRCGKLGAIEAICNIQIYLDEISWDSDGGLVFIDNRFAMQPPQPELATATLPNTPVGEIAGEVAVRKMKFHRCRILGRDSSVTEMPSVPHVMFDSDA